jgi:hypothetical protein
MKYKIINIKYNLNLMNGIIKTYSAVSIKDKIHI